MASSVTFKSLMHFELIFVDSLAIDNYGYPVFTLSFVDIYIHLLTSYRSVQILYFFMTQYWHVVLF